MTTDDTGADTPRRRRRRRLTLKDPPYELVGASDFTRDRREEVHDPAQYLGCFLAEPKLSDGFLEATDFDQVDGRPRNRGSFGLLYLAFTASPHGAMLPFWREVRRNDRLLERCGFRQPDGSLWRPSYQTLCLRFAELEAAPDRFMRTARCLVQHARSFERAIGAHVSLDGTMCSSWARARHDCADRACPDRKRKRLAKLDTERAKEMRQREAEIDRDDPSRPAEVSVGGLRPGEVKGVQPDRDRGGVTWWSGGHRWWCADPDAGPRAYIDEDGRVRYFWVGDLPLQVFDVCTGGMLGVLTRPAHVNEHTGFEEVLDQVTETVGEQPLSVLVDKGYYWPVTYRAAAQRGVLMVGPHRRQTGDPPGAPAGAGARWDDFGDPTCRYCGGRGRRLGFSPSGGRAQITFVCLLPKERNCHGRQTIDCAAHDPRRLIVHSRRSPVYRALYRARNQLERGHALFRDRYNVAASDLRRRSRRLGAGQRHLRAVAAMIVDWIRICVRHGWLGSGPLLGAERRPLPVPPLVEPSADAVRLREKAAAKHRRRHGRRKKRPPS